MQPYTFIIPEDLPQGTTVGDETVSAVGDLDTIDSPFYFYMLDICRAPAGALQISFPFFPLTGL